MEATTTKPATGRVNHAAERRRRSYAMLDAVDPTRGRAVRWCEFALDFRRTGDMDQARSLLRDALRCGAHPPTIYRAWIAMEEERAATGDADAVAGVRELFERWRAWYAATLRGGGGGGGPEGVEDEGGFWCHYIAFELRHGGGGGGAAAARVRAVAERAIAACPRDPTVYARYARAEVRLGCPNRARAVLESALDAFADDAKARDWLRKEMAAAYGGSASEGGWKKLRGFLPFCRGSGRLRCSGSAEAYERLCT